MDVAAREVVPLLAVPVSSPRYGAALTGAPRDSPVLVSPNPARTVDLVHNLQERVSQQNPTPLYAHW